MSTYNYETFDGYVERGDDTREFGAFSTRLHPGEQAPSAALTRLEDGTAIELSDFWRKKPLVMEFGSYT